jgi:hypothetical protein
VGETAFGKVGGAGIGIAIAFGVFGVGGLNPLTREW